MNAHISKPFTYDALLHKLAAILTNTVQPGAILLIEDEYIIRMALAESLRDFGFEVVEAGTIAEALVQLSSNHHRITALLVDVGLPDGRGDDLVVRLRAEGTVLPVVFTTGRGDAKFRDRFQDDPRTRFLIKPFLAEAVVDTLRQLKFVA